MPHLENVSDLIVISSHPFSSPEVRTSEVMNEFARRRRVFFIETPILGVSETPTYFLKEQVNEVTVIQPYLPKEVSVFQRKQAQLELIKEVIADEHISHYTFWTDTPMAMPFIRSLSPEIIVYDCLKDYSESHSELEKELFQYADVVLTSALSTHTMPEKHSAFGLHTERAEHSPKLSIVQS